MAKWRGLFDFGSCRNLQLLLSRLASDLSRRHRTAELQRLIGNLFTARPQNNRRNKSRNNDSALHVHSPDEVKSPTEF